MGRGQTGGVLAAPIFTEFMKVALADTPPKEFQVPPGIELMPIQRATGLLAKAGGDGVILEAFKPGTSPPSSFSIIGYQEYMGQPLAVSPEADRAVARGTGGLY
jgi:penicillin-binding protein 1A